MHILLIGIGVLILFILALNWLAHTTSKNVMIALALTAGILLLGLTAFLVITGKVAIAVPTFAGAWAAFQKYLQLRGLLKWAKSAGAKKEEELAPGQMSRAEALEILGVREGASPGDIRTAYKKLMLEHHPDRAGNPENAKKINEARDTLLRKK